MAAELLNTVAIVISGALLGVTTALFLIVGGIYSILAGSLPAHQDGVDRPEAERTALTESLELQSKISADGVPKSARVAFGALVGLFCLIVIAVWLGPVQMEWMPFILAFMGAELVTIGLYEVSRLLGSKEGPPRAQKS
jgi:hypothetical protein